MNNLDDSKEIKKEDSNKKESFKEETEKHYSLPKFCGIVKKSNLYSLVPISLYIREKK